MSENKTSDVKTKYCTACGEPLVEGAQFCSRCGKSLGETKSEQPTVIIHNNNFVQNTLPDKPLKDKWIALILLLLLGPIGGHKFYEGSIGMGVLYIILAITVIGLPILSICLLIDFFVILTKPNTYTI